MEIIPMILATMAVAILAVWLVNDWEE